MYKENEVLGIKLKEPYSQPLLFFVTFEWANKLEYFVTFEWANKLEYYTSLERKGLPVTNSIGPIGNL
jgi:hypothetical protein